MLDVAPEAVPVKFTVPVPHNAFELAVAITAVGATDVPTVTLASTAVPQSAVTLA